MNTTQPVWTSKDGRSTPVSDLHDTHLANVLRVLHRDVEMMRFRDEYAPKVAEGTNDDDYIDEVMQVSDKVWLEKEHPTYKHLMAEASKRAMDHDFDWQTFGAQFKVNFQFKRVGGRKQGVFAGEYRPIFRYKDRYYSGRVFLKDHLALGEIGPAWVQFLVPKNFREDTRGKKLKPGDFFTIYEGTPVGRAEIVKDLRDL